MVQSFFEANGDALADAMEAIDAGFSSSRFFLDMIVSFYGYDCVFFSGYDCVLFQDAI